MNARLLALLLVFASLGYGIWHYHSDAGRLRQEMDEIKASHFLALKARDEELQTALAAQNSQHQEAIRSLTEEHDKKIAELRQGQRQQVATALKEFDNIFAGNQEALMTLNQMEMRLKAGQEVSKAELEKLVAITTGIAFLQKQYQKPLQEFTALQDYFDEVAKRPNEKPVSKTGFFKRIFSKNFREAEKEYLREEGARRAFEEAQVKFNGVYASAQRQMRAVNLDTDAQLRKLDELIQSKQAANAQDLATYFDQARRALRTHQEVLDFEPEAVPATPNAQ